VCEQSSLRGETCNQCQSQHALDGLIVATHYSNPLVKKAIRNFKFLLVKSLHEQLARLIIKQIEQNSIPCKIEFVIPVPLHKKRLKWRGFNQAELLGNKIAEHLDIHIRTDILVRTKNTKAQSKIHDHETRNENISEAFVCVKPDAVKQKNILLIDDVCSTGSTLNECAGVLKNAGAYKVWGVVVARGQ